MSATPATRIAWQPLTPRGVAAFAEASFDRFQLVKLLAAAFGGISVAAFLWLTCSPVIVEIIQAMPDTARLEHGQLKGMEGSVLRENRFLSLMLDPDTLEQAGQTSDTQLRFGGRSWSFCALRTEVGQYVLGCADFPYEKDWNISLGRPALEPWWGAWHGMVFAAIGLSVFLALLISWVLLGLIYSVPVRLFAFVLGKRITWSGSWRLAGAAMIPGSLLMSLGFWAYGLFLIDLVRFLLIFVLHFVVGWAYLIAAPLTLDPVGPKPGLSQGAGPTVSPAAGPAAGPTPPSPKNPEKSKNPFAS